jgi:hypothetical protein
LTVGPSARQVGVRETGARTPADDTIPGPASPGGQQ